MDCTFIGLETHPSVISYDVTREHKYFWCYLVFLNICVANVANKVFVHAVQYRVTSLEDVFTCLDLDLRACGYYLANKARL